ncbi:unnamed protein product, partial [Ectocarpus sp. 8 AP-2014]
LEAHVLTTACGSRKTCETSSKMCDVSASNVTDIQYVHHGPALHVVNKQQMVTPLRRGCPQGLPRTRMSRARRTCHHHQQPKFVSGARCVRGTTRKMFRSVSSAAAARYGDICLTADVCWHPA